MITLEWNHLLTSIKTKFCLITGLFTLLVVLNTASGKYKQKCWIFITEMAAKVTKGQIWSGTMSSKINVTREYYLCGKFHTRIKNSTGLVLCRSTITKSLVSVGIAPKMTCASKIAAQKKQPISILCDEKYLY